MIHTLPEIIKSSREARFVFYRSGVMYYSVDVMEKREIHHYTFPVPLEDIGNATLNAKEKPLMMMRYLRKGFDDGTLQYSISEIPKQKL